MTTATRREIRIDKASPVATSYLTIEAAVWLDLLASTRWTCVSGIAERTEVSPRDVARLLRRWRRQGYLDVLRDVSPWMYRVRGGEGMVEQSNRLLG